MFSLLKTLFKYPLDVTQKNVVWAVTRWKAVWHPDVQLVCSPRSAEQVFDA